jgi:hypothetical protein
MVLINLLLLLLYSSNFSNFFLFEQFLSNFWLEFKLYSMKCLHVIDNFIFLLLTRKDPGYEDASFSVIFFYLIFKFFYDLCFVICKTFVKKTFSLYNSKQFIRAYGNCIKLLINICREINVKSTNFLNFSSNFFYFGKLSEQLLCFLESNFFVLESNLLGFYEHNRDMPNPPPKKNNVVAMIPGHMVFWKDPLNIVSWGGGEGENSL